MNRRADWSRNGRPWHSILLICLRCSPRRIAPSPREITAQLRSPSLPNLEQMSEFWAARKRLVDLSTQGWPAIRVACWQRSRSYKATPAEAAGGLLAAACSKPLPRAWLTSWHIRYRRQARTTASRRSSAWLAGQSKAGRYFAKEPVQWGSDTPSCLRLDPPRHSAMPRMTSTGGSAEIEGWQGFMRKTAKHELTSWNHYSFPIYPWPRPLFPVGTGSAAA